MGIGDLVQTDYGPGEIAGFQDFFDEKDAIVFVKLRVQGILDRYKPEIKKRGGLIFNSCDVKLLHSKQDD